MKVMTQTTEPTPSLSSLSLESIQEILNKKDKKIDELSSKLNWFEEQLKLLKSKHFAKSTEKQSALQSSLFDEDGDVFQEEDERGKQVITYTRTKPNRKSKHLDTSKLPREKHYIDLPEEEKQCACGACLEKIGEETKEEIVFKPATLKVIEHIRIKYTCRRCETVTTPQAIELPILKSKAGASLLTEIILNKYSYHLPLYRQRRMLTPLNLDIPDNTLGGWVMRSAEQLESLGEAFWIQLPSVHLLQADETPVKVLKPEKKAYMWLYHCYLPGKRFVIFDFNLSRGSEVVNERLKNFKGILQTDGYYGYNAQRKREDIISLGCWDHARRKFADVVKACGHNKSGKAGKMLEKIADLYGIEATIKNLSIDERKKLRQKNSKPMLDDIKDFLYKINAPPKSLLGVAVTYAKNQWASLIRYIDHGEAQISNCLIENQVRPFAIGKRNWLFLGNETSAKKAALLYSLIQSCTLNDIDPRSYLHYVLTQVHRMRRKEVDPAALLPNTIDRALL